MEGTAHVLGRVKMGTVRARQWVKNKGRGQGT